MDNKKRGDSKPIPVTDEMIRDYEEGIKDPNSIYSRIMRNEFDIHKRVAIKDAGTILITFPKNNNHKPNHTPQYGC